MSSQEIRTSKTNPGVSIVVDAYFTSCCHDACPGLSVHENESQNACLITGSKLNRFGFWTGTRDCKFERCRECVIAYPDPVCDIVPEIPDFVPDHQYRFRYVGKTEVHLCTYVEYDAWGRHVFRCGEPGEGMLMWWCPDSTYLDWVVRH